MSEIVDLLARKFEEHLTNTAYDEDGWLSNAQDADLRQGLSDIYFNGEGSIDVGQVAYELAAIAEGLMNDVT